MTVEADISNVPELLDDFDWEDSKLSWTVRLQTESSEQRIAQIFEFAEGLGDLDIQPLMRDLVEVPEAAETAPIVDTAELAAPVEVEEKVLPKPIQRIMST